MNHVRNFAFALLALSFAGSANAYPGGSVRQLVEMLIRENRIAVDMTSAEKGCGTLMAAKKGDKVDVGELLSFLIEKLGYGEGKAAIRPECDPQGDKMRCTLWFASSTGTPEMWRGSIRFEFNPKAMKVEKGSISCPSGS